MPKRLFFLVVLMASAVVVGCGPSTKASGSGDGWVDGGSGDGTTGDVDAGACETILCGSPAVCCDAGQECIEGQCMDECASGVRCGADLSTCCPTGDVCLSQQCATPGGLCNDSYDCQQPGEFCEPTLGRCLPQPDPLTCEVVPTFTDLDVTVEWSFETDQVISIPVVADINGDNVPEVVLNLTQQDGLSWPGGIKVLEKF